MQVIASYPSVYEAFPAITAHAKIPALIWRIYFE